MDQFFRSFTVIAVSCAALPAPSAIAQPGSPDSAIAGPAVTAAGSPYTGRFAASTYRFDSGSVASGYGSSAPNYDAVWVTRFDASGGEDAITSVTTPFAFTPVGTTATIYLWDDPNDDGDPSDRVLLATVPVSVQSQCFCTSPSFNVFQLPQPVPVRGSFFIGIKVPAQSGQFPAVYECSTPYAPNRSFGRMISSGFNPVTSPFIPYGSAGSPVTWLIRANGSNSGFTYQGSLNVSGAAYTGNADLIATIYDAASGGAAVSPSFAMTGISVTNGLFTVRIPADASSFDPGSDRWLELAVKRAGEPNYTTLTSRQRITSVPTALAAARVDWSGLTNIPATLPPWNQVSGGISYNAGNVGIQNTAPASMLEIGSFSNPGDRYIQINSAGGNNYRAGIKLRHFSATNGFTIVSDERGSAGLGLHFIDEEPGPVSFTRLFIENATGNVGIGTTSPSQRLTVNGNVLANNVVVPSSARFKDHVVPLNDALDGLLKLDGVRFDWKPQYATSRSGRVHDLGFVAEDVEKIFPELVFRDADGNVTGMDYSRLTAVAVAAIKEQQARFEADKAAKQREIDELKARLERLEHLVTGTSPPPK